jgi:hypothetical protein
MPPFLGVVINFIRLRRRPRAWPWMNAKRHQFIATARCHPKGKADNRVVAEGEDGYFNGTTGLPVGIHSNYDSLPSEANPAPGTKPSSCS